MQKKLITSPPQKKQKKTHIQNTNKQFCFIVEKGQDIYDRYNILLIINL